MFRFLCIALVPLALVNAEYLYGEQPYVHNTEYASAYDNYKPRDYKYEYGVSDPHTGDHKAQWEVRENGVVRGAYSLLEADGTTRVVEYYADDTGFHADVKKLGTAVHDAPAVAPVVAPVIKANIADGIAYNGYGHGGLEHGYGAPIAAVQHVAPITKVVAPIEQLAPIAKVEHIAPVQQVIAPEIQPLAQYAPVHYENYAPLLAKAAPAQIAHEYKLDHEVAYPQHGQILAKYAPAVNTYHHEAPIDKYSPIAAAYYGPVQSYPVEQAHYIQKEHAYAQAPIALEKTHIAPAPIALQKASIAQAGPFYIKDAQAYSEQEHHLHAAPAPSLYSHEINFAPAQEIKYSQEVNYAPAQEIKYSHDVKYAPAQEIKYTPEVKYAPAAELKYAPAPELKYVPAPELKYVPAPELKYIPAPELQYVQAQELKYAQAPQVNYAPAPVLKYASAPAQYKQEVKYTQTPAPINYVKAQEHYNHEVVAPAQEHYNHEIVAPAQIHYAKENAAPIYYEEAKPQHNVQIVHKAAPSVDYEALNYFGAANGYKPELKASHVEYEQYNQHGY